MQRPDGTWPYNEIGATALAGLTLLECGVRPADPAVRRAAGAVRTASVEARQTYSLSLSVLFLDRLGDLGDRDRIQTMALRLVAGQDQTGGWGYVCPVLKLRQEHDLLLALQKRESASLPPEFRNLPALQPPAKSHAMPRQDTGFRTNNSTTQFAVLGLWAARRHKLPLERPLAHPRRRRAAGQPRVLVHSSRQRRPVQACG
jgi:hypothetical protein